MSHQAQRDFCQLVKRQYSAHFHGVKVLDVGSLDINGNNRYLFDKYSTYHGCDIVAGKNVDIVAPCWDLPDSMKDFSVVISTEMLEHDVYWFRSVETMGRLVAPGGLLILTWATPGRKIHNTPPGGYYWNLSIEQVVSALDQREWDFISTTMDEGHHDGYLVARKRREADHPVVEMIEQMLDDPSVPFTEEGHDPYREIGMP